MKIVFKYLTSILFLLFSFNILAQDFELLKIRSAYYPKQSIEESSVDGEIGFFEWGGQLAIPQTFKKNKKTILIHKVLYANLRADIEGNPANGLVVSNKYYHTISYNLGLVQTLSPKWRLILNLNPTLASDFEESLSEDDLLYQANAMIINTKNTKFQYGFGLAYTTRFGRQIVIPMGMLNYRTAKMNLNIVLPNKLSVLFKKADSKFLYGLEAGLNGGLFNNTNDVQTINTLIDETGYSRFTFGPALSLNLKNGVKIQFNGGVAVGRKLEFIDANEEVFDRTPEVGPFFSMGISFSPKKKNGGEGQSKN